MTKKIFIPRKSVTLMELLIAISLLTLVFLSVLAVDLFSRRQLAAVDFRTRLANEISPVIQHMAGSITRGIGDISDPGVVINPGSNTIWVRIDEGTTPYPYTNDIWRRYGYKAAQRSITYCSDFDVASGNCNTALEVLSTKITNAIFSRPDASNPTLISLNITACYDPSRPVGPENPEINLQTDVSLRSMSIQ